MRNFKVGDKVAFEVIHTTMERKWRGRWNGSIDSLAEHDNSFGPPHLTPGKVVCLDSTRKNFLVHPENPGVYIQSWPQPSQPNAAYGKPGYLRLLIKEAVSKQENNICTCPIQDLWNFGCRCGVEK